MTSFSAEIEAIKAYFAYGIIQKSVCPWDIKKYTENVRESNQKLNYFD